MVLFDDHAEEVCLLSLNANLNCFLELQRDLLKKSFNLGQQQNVIDLHQDEYQPILCTPEIQRSLR